MSSLRERIEGLAHLSLEIHKPEPGGCTCGFCAYGVEHVVLSFARELAAALVAEGPGEQSARKCFAELWGLGEFDCGPEDYEGMTEQTLAAFHELRQVKRAAAPSLHKEGCGDSLEQPDQYDQPQPPTTTTISAALHKEGAGGAPLEFHKPGQIPVNAPTCDKCGKIFLDCQCSQAAPGTERAQGERNADLKADLVLSIRLAVLREVKKIYDDGGTSSKVYEWLIEQIHNPIAASPAGRAEQADAPKETR